MERPRGSGKEKLPRQKKQHKTQQRLRLEEPTSNRLQFIAAPSKDPVNSSQNPAFGILKKNLFESGKGKGILGELRGELEGEKTSLYQLDGYSLRHGAVPSDVFDTWFCDAKAGDVCSTKSISQMCIQMCLGKHPPALILPSSSSGTRGGFLVTSSGAKWFPSYTCKWGEFSLLFLTYHCNEVRGMTALVSIAVLPNHLHLAFLHWD